MKAMKTIRTLSIAFAVLALASLSGCAPRSEAEPRETPRPLPTIELPPTQASPLEVVEQFYAWYLAATRGPAPAAAMNEGMVQESGYLTPEGVRRIEETIASFQGGGYDPVLCAQDVPESVSVQGFQPGAAQAEVWLGSSFAGHRLKVILLHGEEGWRIDEIVCLFGQEEAPVIAAPAPATPAPTAPAVASGPTAMPEVAPSGPADAATDATIPAGWKVYTNGDYGFRIAYPADWTYTEAVNAPDQPPMGPPNLKASVMFMPQEWADRLSHGGPPDPNAPVLPPLAVEVTEGTWEEYRNTYYDPTEAEELQINGRVVVREVEQITDELATVRYWCECPQRPDVRITVVDYISGFPQRLAGNEAVVETYRQMIATLVLE